MIEKEDCKEDIIEAIVLPAYKAYISENYGNESYCVYNLIYIDEDNIPELLLDNSGDGRGTELLSYQNGKVFNSSVWCRGYGFKYLPKENIFYAYGVYLGDEFGMVAHLECGVLVENHSDDLDFDVDGMEDGWCVKYPSIRDAYENIGR